MAYEAEVSRNNPSAFLFLVDMSGSMTDPYANGKRKADGVADAINKLLTNLSIKCTKSEGVRDYYDVGVISYGKQVTPALGGELTGLSLAPISAVANHPARVEERTRQEDDGTGAVSEMKVKFPVWFDPKAAGSTPMCKAFKAAREALEPWVAAHPYSFPPIVINITDGESTDGDPSADAQSLRWRRRTATRCCSTATSPERPARACCSRTPTRACRTSSPSCCSACRASCRTRSATARPARASTSRTTRAASRSTRTSWS
jgi:uncharacterized protein YegL